MGSCAKCGRVVPDGRPACMYCGTRAESMVSCPTCGRQLLASAPKCNYCGRAKSTSLHAPTPEEVSRVRSETFQQAELARAARHFPQALPLYEQVVAVDPANVRAWLGLGKTLTHLQRAPEAVAALDRALALQPDQAEAIALRKSLVPPRLPSSAVFRAVTTDTAIAAAVARATQLVASGEATQALIVLDTALGVFPEPALHPSLVGLHHTRGLVLRALSRSSEALAAQEHALRCEPRHAKAWIEKGELLGELGRNDDALTALENAVAYDPNDAAGWFARGNVLARLARTEDAVASYDRALTIDASFAPARSARSALTSR